jgi:hypothetical protein
MFVAEPRGIEPKETDKAGGRGGAEEDSGGFQDTRQDTQGGERELEAETGTR